MPSTWPKKMEMTKNNTKDLKDTADNPVLSVSIPNSPLCARRPCFYCRRTNHDAQHCKFCDATCHSCGKTGHSALACHKTKARRECSATLVSDSPSNGKSDFLQMHMIGYHLARPITTMAKINGKEVTMEVGIYWCSSIYHLLKSSRPSVSRALAIIHGDRAANLYGRTYTSGGGGISRCTCTTQRKLTVWPSIDCCPQQGSMPTWQELDPT